ncbi:MAG: hypothetical protein M1816_003684 [Peltula sp. TS41687]|nr:MAG: hypothetical protein M1816_003684 [Peltula sp. TS41687]
MPQLRHSWRAMPRITPQGISRRIHTARRRRTAFRYQGFASCWLQSWTSIGNNAGGAEGRLRGGPLHGLLYESDMGSVVRQSSTSEHHPPTMQLWDDWVLLCIVIQTRRDLNAVTKASWESNEQGKDSQGTEHDAVPANQMQIKAAILSPLKNFKENAMNGLTKVFHAINSVHNGNPAELSPASAPASITNPGIMAPLEWITR